MHMLWPPSPRFSVLLADFFFFFSTPFPFHFFSYYGRGRKLDFEDAMGSTCYHVSPFSFFPFFPFFLRYAAGHSVKVLRIFIVICFHPHVLFFPFFFFNRHALQWTGGKEFDLDIWLGSIFFFFFFSFPFSFRDIRSIYSIPLSKLGCLAPPALFFPLPPGRI